MPERLLDRLDGTPLGVILRAGQVGPHDRRAGRIEAYREALVDGHVGRLDRYAARSDPRQDVADRLDRLQVGLDAQFEPALLSRGRP